MSARPSARKRPRNLSPTTTLNVMNSNSNSGMNSNSNAGIMSPSVKRAKTIREANTQPTPIPLRTAAVGAANNILMKAKANANNKTITNVRSVPRVNSQPKSLRRSTRVKNIKGGTGRATPARAPSIRKGVMKRPRVTSSAIKNAKLLMNVSRQAAAEKAATINAKANANAKERGNANDVERRKKSPVMNLKAKRKAAAIAQVAVNTKAAANKVAANVRAKAAANRVNANARAKAAANARAKVAANARAATPANSARNSVTNIGNGGNSLNNNANSSAFIGPNKKTVTQGKLKKKAILLEIIKIASRTMNMAKNKPGSLLKLMPMVKNVNSITEYHTYTWALLYDMISTIDGTKLAQIQITSKTLKDIHKKLMVKNTYTTGRTSTNGGMGNRREHVFNFTDEEVVEFLFLIWLDGNHDEYIHKSFIEWLDDKNSNSTYFTTTHRALAKKFVGEFPDPRKYIKNVPKFSGNKREERKKFKTQLFKNITGYDTIRKICIETEAIWFFIHDYNGDPAQMHTKSNPLQTSVKMGFGTFSSGKPVKTSLALNFETELKMGIEKILNIKQSDFIFTGSREINKLKRNGIHEVSLDMEGAGKTLSRAITNTPSFRPYFTTANLIDPGKYMLHAGSGSDDRELLLGAMRTQNIQILDNLKGHYHIGPVKFVIRNSNLDFLKVDLSIRKGGPPISGGQMPTLDFFQLKINEKDIKQGETKKGATTPSTKMGKFMGDALQYMVVAIQNKYRGRERYFIYTFWIVLYFSKSK